MKPDPAIDADLLERAKELLLTVTFKFSYEIDKGKFDNFTIELVNKIAAALQSERDKRCGPKIENETIHQACDRICELNFRQSQGITERHLACWKDGFYQALQWNEYYRYRDQIKLGGSGEGK